MWNNMGLLERVLNAIFSVVIMMIAIGLFCCAIPLWIIGWDFRLFPLEVGVFRFIGLAPIILGFGMMAGLIWGWVLSGTGSPLPLDLPKELIVRGSYRFVRNPMYVGYLLILLGEILLFKSSPLLLYLLTCFVILHTFVVLVEEPMLKLKFGESYEKYCKSVPRWIPNLKGFRRRALQP
jgi:protein-S-isoprenylcysteine O-methyltransferase Ste14